MLSKSLDSPLKRVGDRHRAKRFILCLFLILTSECALATTDCRKILAEARQSLQVASEQWRPTADEWIEIKNESLARPDLAMLASSRRRESSGLLARYLGDNGNGKVRLRTYLVASNEVIAFEALAEDIRPLPVTTTTARFGAVVNAFSQVQRPAFREGQIAAARLNPTGEMTYLRVLGISGDAALIRLPGGRTQEDVPLDRLSLPPGPHYAFSLPGRDKGEMTQIEGSLRAFFDAGRRMTSSPDFKALSNLEKLRHVVAFVSLFALEDHSIAYDFSGLPPDVMICAGGGVCNQKAYYVANLLSEAGYRVQIQSRSTSDVFSGNGHSWAAVHFDVPQGDAERYLVDPGKPVDILTRVEADALARRDHKSLAGQFYSWPTREIFDPQGDFLDSHAPGSDPLSKGQ